MSRHKNCDRHNRNYFINKQKFLGVITKVDIKPKKILTLQLWKENSSNKLFLSAHQRTLFLTNVTWCNTNIYHFWMVMKVPNGHIDWKCFKKCFHWAWKLLSTIKQRMFFLEYTCSNNKKSEYFCRNFKMKNP